MRKAFTAAVDLFRALEDWTENMIDKVLKINKQVALACRSCPACFGPEPDKLKDHGRESQNKVIVCLDGNFQHRHHVSASRDYEQLRPPTIFLAQPEVDDMIAQI